MFNSYQLKAGSTSLAIEYEHVSSLDDDQSVVIRLRKKAATQLLSLTGYVVIFTKSNSKYYGDQF